VIAFKPVVFACVLAAAGAAMAHNHGMSVSDLMIEAPWARATAGGQPDGAAYPTIKSAGATDKPLSASARWPTSSNCTRI
jgi:copper(I)-binding protein